MSKTQRQVLTAIGVIVGLVVGVFVFQKVVGNEMIEAGDFVKAVFAGGLVGIALYVLIKDGVPYLLNRRAGVRPVKAAPAPPPAAAQPAAARRKEPLRAAGRERPLRTERPLKPRD